MWWHLSTPCLSVPFSLAVVYTEYVRCSSMTAIHSQPPIILGLNPERQKHTSTRSLMETWIEKPRPSVHPMRITKSMGAELPILSLLTVLSPGSGLQFMDFLYLLSHLDSVYSFQIPVTCCCPPCHTRTHSLLVCVFAYVWVLIFNLRCHLSQSILLQRFTTDVVSPVSCLRITQEPWCLFSVLCQ